MEDPLSTYLRRLTCAVALVGLTAGCSSGSDVSVSASSPPAPQSSAAAPASSVAVPPSSAATPSSAASPPAGVGGAGVEQFDPGAALVTQTVSLPSDEDDTVEVSVLSLKVQGEVMELRLALTPQLATTSGTGVVSQFQALGMTGFRPTLVDAGHLKEYNVLTSTSAGQWASSDLNTKAQNGSPMLAYAWFAAPEDDIDTIDVRVTDFWPAFTDVPITR